MKNFILNLFFKTELNEITSLLKSIDGKLKNKL